MSHHPLTIDFYVYALHEIDVWEPIWWQLRSRGIDAQFVVEPPGVNRSRGSAPDPANGWLDDKADSEVVELMDQAMFDRSTQRLASSGIGWIETLRPDADVAVTTSGVGWLGAYQGAKVRTMYGVGAVTDSYGHGPVNRGLDAVLVHGAFSERAIAEVLPRERIHTVGFPKWAPALRSHLGRVAHREALGLADDDRPVVAWLPTWAHNSSLDSYRDAIADLSRDHLVVAKPHHNNLRFEKRRLADVPDEITMLDGVTSLVSPVLAADVVVGDVRSGGITEALLADRPVVGLVTSGHVESQHLLAGLEEAVSICVDPQDLRGAIERAKLNEAAAARRRWAQWFFDATDHDDERAADALITIGRRARRSLRIEVSLGELEDALNDLGASPEVDRVAQLILLIWPSWAGDPRLIALLEHLRAAADPGIVARCARPVRESGHIELCPLRSYSRDAGNPIEHRIAGCALGSLIFGDDDLATEFLELCQQVAKHDLESCLVSLLTHAHAAVPTFVSVASTQGSNRPAIVKLLRSHGVEAEEVELLLSAA